MVVLNTSGGEINAKVVYYGPGVSGKTTNLEYIHEKMPAHTKGKLVSMKTRTDRTLFFDFLPIELGEINGFRTRFLLYTVPGQVYYNATRKLVLNGADAVVFVADSSRAKLEENIESLRNLEDNLNEHGMSLDHLPWVIQYNKRDIPDAMPVGELHGQLNLLGVPAFEAVATQGRGVYETFQGIATLLYDVLKRRLDQGGDEAGEATAGPAAPVAALAEDSIDNALREVTDPATPSEPLYQTVGAPNDTRRRAPSRVASAPDTRAQSVGSPGGKAAGQPAASAPEIRVRGAGPGRARVPEEDTFGFESLPSSAEPADQSSTRRIAEAEAASEAAREEAIPEFIIDPMRHKARNTPARASKEKTDAAPRPVTTPAHTVDLSDAHPERFDDVAVPEAPDDADITVPVTVTVSRLRSGRPLRLVLDVQIIED